MNKHINKKPSKKKANPNAPDRIWVTSTYDGLDRAISNAMDEGGPSPAACWGQVDTRKAVGRGVQVLYNGENVYTVKGKARVEYLKGKAAREIDEGFDRVFAETADQFSLGVVDNCVTVPEELRPKFRARMHERLDSLISIKFPLTRRGVSGRSSKGGGSTSGGTKIKRTCVTRVKRINALLGSLSKNNPSCGDETL